jgi:putative Holliday junction resolvase
VTLVVGIDLGERRIGVATTDETGHARPYATIPRGATVADDIVALRRVLPAGPITVVLGLPLEASGVEGTQSGLTRAWAVEAERILGQPIAFRDERLTSHLAEERLGPMKRGRSGGPPTSTQRRAYRERVDREAAAIILQDELDARAAAAATSATAAPASLPR